MYCDEKLHAVLVRTRRAQGEMRRPTVASLLCSYQQGTAAEVALGLHMLAGNLVWLVPRTAQPGVRQQIMDHLCRLSDVLLPESESDPSAAPKLPQVWHSAHRRMRVPWHAGMLCIDEGVFPLLKSVDTAQVSKDQRQQAALPLLEAAMDIDQGGAQAGEDGDKTFGRVWPVIGHGNNHVRPVGQAVCAQQCR